MMEHKHRYIILLRHNENLYADESGRKTVNTKIERNEFPPKHR
jgi:hypothetical protein